MKRKIDFSPTAHDGRSKVERYQWGRLGDRGKFMSVEKSELAINSEYQRSLRETTVSAICREFSWAAFGVLLVFRSGDGTLRIVDGQNRHAAAMRRADIGAVPCLVFDGNGAEDEAREFLRVNTIRKAVSAIEKHAALIMLHDPLAQEAKSMVEASGRRVRNDSGAASFRPIGSLVQALVTRPDHIRRIWPTVCQAFNGQVLTNVIIDGLVYVEAKIHPELSLSDKRWSQRLALVGADELNASATREAALYGSGGARVWAFGIVGRLNKGVRNGLKIGASEAGQ